MKRSQDNAFAQPKVPANDDNHDDQWSRVDKRKAKKARKLDAKYDVGVFDAYRMTLLIVKSRH